MNNFWYGVIYIISTVVSSIIILMIWNFFDKKIFEWKLRDLKFYLNHFKFNDSTYEFDYNDTHFTIAVDYNEYTYSGYFETLDVYINDEKAVSIYSLEHLWVKSRRVDFNSKRLENEVKKIIKQARKKLKKMYAEECYNKYSNSNVSYFNRRI